MSRITYCEEEDYPNQGVMWEANRDRSLRGKRGQTALREMEAALLALPTKRLVANELETKSGEVCAIGALARFKGKANPHVVADECQPLADDEILPDELEEVTIGLAQELGMPRMVALTVVHENDDYWPPSITPEIRYQKVLTWVQRQIASSDQQQGQALD